MGWNWRQRIRMRQIYSICGSSRFARSTAVSKSSWLRFSAMRSPNRIWGVTTEEFATTLTYGMRGLRYASSSVDDMKRMIEVHVEAYARALGSGGTL
jgi:hypothetical protein